MKPVPRILLMALILILILGLAFIAKSLERDAKDESLDKESTHQTMVSHVNN